MANFLKIVITPPVDIENEAGKITQLLESGIDFVHIRKPDASVRDIRNLIEDIPYPLRKRLKLHGHFELLNDFSLGGAHLNTRCPIAPASALNISKSCHNLKELESVSQFEYVTLSPIYDSISKQGYLSRFKPQNITTRILGKRVIALGGVTPYKFSELRDAGFFGAAMLGCVWKDFDSFINLIK